MSDTDGHVVKCGGCGRHYNTLEGHDCPAKEDPVDDKKRKPERPIKTDKNPDRDRQAKPRRDREARPGRDRGLDSGKEMP